MQKSLQKQLALIIFFGPFGLVYTNIVAALAVVFATLFAIYSSTGSPKQLIIIGSIALITSFVLGIHLVDKQNRRAAKEFQMPTYSGGLSYRMIRKEAPQRDYHSVLSNVRRKKVIKNTLLLCLTSLCIVYSALIIKPYLTFPDPPAPTAQTMVVVNAASLPPLRGKPVWVHKQQDKTFTSTIDAIDYTSSSVGLYLPEFQLSCRESNYKLRFNVEEVLGTGSAPISTIFDDKPAVTKHWILDPSYRSANTELSPQLLSQLRSANYVSVMYTPFGQDQEKAARFSLAGSAKAIGIFSKSCELQ